MHLHLNLVNKKTTETIKVTTRQKKDQENIYFFGQGKLSEFSTGTCI